MYELPLFPLNTVLFPNMPLSLHIFEPRYKLMIEQCLAHDEPHATRALELVRHQHTQGK